jgi:hypothetical protein
MENLLNHLIAAKVNTGQDSVQLITPYEIDGDWVEFYWYDGPTKCRMLIKSIEVLYNYGVPKKDSDWWDNTELHYLQTYYPATTCEPKQSSSGGFYSWIAPNGDFYHCNYNHHDATARSIYASLFGEVLAGYEAREELLKTWLQLSGTDHIFGRWDNDDYSITSDQKRVIEGINETFDTKFDLEFREVE